jgi:hypothetical protein
MMEAGSRIDAERYVMKHSSLASIKSLWREKQMRAGAMNATKKEYTHCHVQD